MAIVQKVALLNCLTVVIYTYCAYSHHVLFSSYPSSSIHPLYPHLLPTSTAVWRTKFKRHHHFSLSTSHPVHMLDHAHPLISIFCGIVLNQVSARDHPHSLLNVLSTRRWFRSEKEASETTDTGPASAKKKLATLIGGSQASQWRNYGRAGGAVAPPLLKNRKQ